MLVLVFFLFVFFVGFKMIQFVISSTFTPIFFIEISFVLPPPPALADVQPLEVDHKIGWVSVAGLDDHIMSLKVGGGGGGGIIWFLVFIYILYHILVFDNNKKKLFYYVFFVIF